MGGAVLGAPPSSTMLSGSTIKCVTSFGSLGLAANSVTLVGRFRFCCWIATGWLTSSRSLFGSFPRRRSIPDTYGKPLTTSPVIIRHFNSSDMVLSFRLLGEPATWRLVRIPQFIRSLPRCRPFYCGLARGLAVAATFSTVWHVHLLTFSIKHWDYDRSRNVVSNQPSAELEPVE